MNKSSSKSGFSKKGSGAWKRLFKNRTAIAGLVILFIIVVVAVFADAIAPYEYDEVNYDHILESPSKDFPFGTDTLGRDVFSRVIYGARTSLKVGVLACLFETIIGFFIGCVAGFYGGIADTIIMRLMDVMLAIPRVLLTIVIASVLGTGINNLIIAIGVAGIPMYARIARASIISLRGQEYIEAASLSGCSDWRIILRHILPNILAPILVQVTMALGGNILGASSLSFLGLGVQAPIPEWGAMLADGRAYIRSNGYMILFPGLAIMMTVMSFNLFGDGLRDALDPRMKR